MAKLFKVLSNPTISKGSKLNQRLVCVRDNPDETLTNTTFYHCKSPLQQSSCCYIYRAVSSGLQRCHDLLLYTLNTDVFVLR